MVVCDFWELSLAQSQRKTPKSNIIMEPSLDLRLGFVPKPLSLFFGDVSGNRDKCDKVVTLDGFVQRLEEELTKVEAFKRELPLCILLLNDGACLVLEFQCYIIVVLCCVCFFSNSFFFVLRVCSYSEIEGGKSEVFGNARSAS